MADVEIKILQGVTTRRVFAYQDGDGTPIALTNFRVVAQFRQRAGGLLIDDWSDNVTLEPNGAIGEIHLRVGADVTESYTKGGVFELRLVEIADPTEVLELVSGKVTFVKQVADDAPVI